MRAPRLACGRVPSHPRPCRCLLRRKRLATVPVLQKCVDGVALLRSRVFKRASSVHAPLTDALEGAAAGRFPLLVLFPGAGARDVQDAGAELRSGGSTGSSLCSVAASSSSNSGSPGAAAGDARDARQARQDVCQPQQQQQQQGEEGGDPLYVLLVIDGTWQQAKEMAKVLLPQVLQPNGPGVRVMLPPPQRAAGQQAEQDSAPAADAAAVADPAGTAPLLLRMEPMEGCMTTCEAGELPCFAWDGGTAGALPGLRGTRAACRTGQGQQRRPRGPCCMASHTPRLPTCAAVARALGALEPSGSAVHEAILRPLAQMALFQAQFDPAVAARLATGSGYSQSRCRMGMGRLGDLTQRP